MALLSTWLLPTDLDEKQNAAALTPEEAGVYRGGVGMAGSVLPGRPLVGGSSLDRDMWLITMVIVSARRLGVVVGPLRN